jgi:nuclear RNA export factor
MDLALSINIVMLVYQDGNDLPPPIVFDVSSAVIPASEGSYFVNPSVQELLVKFLKEYYSIYDSDNRQPLIDAYHDNALFSLSVSNNPTTEYKQPFLGNYFNFSRNEFRVKGKDDGDRCECQFYGNLLLGF